CSSSWVECASHSAERRTRIMLLSRLTVLVHASLVSVAALFWLCAVSLYIGRLELEIIHDEDEEEHVGDESGERERRGAEEKGQD
ncbi:hypothetical protein M9458_029940, partial [Cirrhinus mrigala]